MCPPGSLKTKHNLTLLMKLSLFETYHYEFDVFRCFLCMEVLVLYYTYVFVVCL